MPALKSMANQASTENSGSESSSPSRRFPKRLAPM